MSYIVGKFIITVFIASLALVFLPHLALEEGWISSEPSFSLQIIVSLGVLTSTLFYYLQRIQKSNPKGFVQFYLLSITIKITVGCALILVVILIDKPGAMANALLFIASYFTLTGIEIFFLLRPTQRE
jgi:hypothetical protein